QVFIIVSVFRNNCRSFTEIQRMTPEEVKQRPPKPSAYMNILTTYSQISEIFFLGTSSALIGFFDTTSTIGNPTKKIFFSLQCFLLNINPDQFEIMKFKVLLVTLSPIVKIFALFFFECLRFLIVKKRNRKLE